MRMAISPIGPGPITATVPPGRTPDNSNPCSTTPAVSTSAPSRKLIVAGIRFTLFTDSTAYCA